MLGTKYEGFDRLSIYHDQMLEISIFYSGIRILESWRPGTKVRVGFKKLLTKVFV